MWFPMGFCAVVATDHSIETDVSQYGNPYSKTILIGWLKNQFVC